MDKQIKTITTTVFMSGLVLLSASYVAPFQNWVSLNSVSLNNHKEQQVVNVFEQVGIRSIVSEDRLSKPLLSILPENSAADKNVTIVKKQTPLEQDEPFTKQPLYSLPTLNKAVYQPQVIQEVTPLEPEDYQKTSKTPMADKILPLVVELEDEIIVEFTADYTDRDIQKVISRLLVQSKSLNVNDLVTNQVINTRLKPYLYGKALDQYENPIRYPAQAYKYAEYLVLNNRENIHDEQGQFKVITIPLTEHQLPRAIQNYQAWVKEYAKKYQVSAELIFAIMHVESAFNPKAVSQSNALGLMQVKANAAGRDVYQYIDQRAGQPTKSELFNPKENIRVGTAYMSLLNHMYLKDIRNPSNKELVAISAYNGGLSTVLKLFGNSPEKAIKRINRLHPSQVYRTLRYSHESEETKQYIEKVTQAKNRYKELLNFAA